MSVSAPEAASHKMPSKQSSGRVVDIERPEDFDALLEESAAANSLLIADFHAAWCRKCKYLLPRLRKLANEHPDVYFATVDVNKVARLPREFDIQKMPTFIFFSGGEQVEKLIGAAEAGAVVSSLRSTLEKHISVSE